MAHGRDDSFHYPLKESPLHSRWPSIASDWNELADSSRQLVLPGTNQPDSERERYDAPHYKQVGTPTPQSFTSLASPSSSPGFHPGFPRPETPSSPYDSTQQTWPDSLLAMPPNARHFREDSQYSLQSDSNEQFKPVSQEDTMPPKEAAPRPGPPGGPPPDGGTTAWLQVLGGYFLFFNTWGLINAFGRRRHGNWQKLC